jgi:hypothetical protein
MASIAALRTGIATNLGTISGLRTSATGFVPDNVNPPYAIVAPTTVDYHKSFSSGGLNTYNFTVTVVVGRVSERTSQASLDAYCSPTGASSIKVAVESDRTLSGNAYDCVVTGMRNYGSITIAENTYLAAEFDLVVQAN